MCHGSCPGPLFSDLVIEDYLLVNMYLHSKVPPTTQVGRVVNHDLRKVEL